MIRFSLSAAAPPNGCFQISALSRGTASTVIRKQKSPTGAAAPGSWMMCIRFYPKRQSVLRRSEFASISLCPLALRHTAAWPNCLLARMLDLCVAQLLERFEIQYCRKVRNFFFLMSMACGWTIKKYLLATKCAGACSMTACLSASLVLQKH